MAEANACEAFDRPSYTRVDRIASRTTQHVLLSWVGHTAGFCRIGGGAFVFAVSRRVFLPDLYTKHQSLLMLLFATNRA